MTNQAYSAFLESEIGYWLVMAQKNKLLGISFSTTKPDKKPRKNEIIDLALSQLQEYFDKKRISFDLPLEISSYSPFYQNVWHELMNIPYGKTTNYSALAQNLDNPKAVRAVGTANGKNPFAIVVPCHRVIGKDNSMTGYAHGINVKEWLLVHEGAIVKPLTLF